MQEFIQDIHQILVGINTTATIEEKISELRENDWRDYVIQFESNAASCKLNYGSEMILSVLITGIQIGLHQTKDTLDEKHFILFQALRRYINTNEEVELFFKRGGCEMILEAFDIYRRNFLFAGIILEIIEKVSLNELNQNKLYELGLSPLLLSVADLSLPVEMIAKICEVCIPLSKNTTFLNDLLHSTLITAIIKPLRLSDDPNDYPAVRSSLQLVAVLCDTQSGRQVLYRDHEITDRFIHCLKEYYMQGDIVYLTVLAMQSAHFDKDIFQSFRCSDVFSGLFAGLKVQWKHLDLVREVITLLHAITIDENDKVRFRREAGCEILPNILNKYSHPDYLHPNTCPPDLIQLLCDSISSYASEEDNAKAFGDFGCCEALGRTFNFLISTLSSLSNSKLRKNKTLSAAIDAALKAMIILADSNDNNREKFRLCQTISMLNKIMDRYKSLASMIQEACILLEKLAKDRQCQIEFLRIKIYKPLIKCIDLHAENPELVQYLMNAFVIIIQHKSQFDLFHKEEYCIVPLKTLKFHIQEASIVCSVGKAIGYIANTSENQLIVGNAVIQGQEACSLLKEALELHQKDPLIARILATAIMKLSQAKNNQIKFGSLGMMALLVKLLNQHEDDATCLKALCEAVQWISRSYDEEYKWKTEGASQELVEAASNGSILSVVNAIRQLSDSVCDISVEPNSSISEPLRMEIFPTILSQNLWNRELFEKYINEFNSKNSFDAEDPSPFVRLSFNESFKSASASTISSSTTGGSSVNFEPRLGLHNIVHATKILFSESVQAARLEFHEHDGCALLCKVLSKSITQPEILIIVVDTIHHLAVHPTIISAFGSRNCCKHLVHAIRHNKTDEECLLHLLPAIKRLAEDNANKIRFDNCQATKECIDIFTHWVSIQEKKENDIATEIQKELDEMSREKDISASAIQKRLKREKLRLPIISALIETLIPLTEELLYENNPQILYPKIPRATLDQFMKITSFYLMKEDITLMHPLAKVMINITKQLDGEFPQSIYTEIYNGLKMYCAIGNIRQREFNISILMMKNYFYMINNLSRKTKRAEVFGGIGCCELLVALLRLFTDLNQASPTVITNMQQKDRNLFIYELCHTIHQLTNKNNNQNKRVFRHAGACDILIALLNKIPFDSNHGHSTFTVLHACIECISNLAEDKINRKIFSTAIKQLCDVLREYVERREIVGATILALQRITYQNENNQKTLGIHKGPESLIRALFLYLHDKVMIESIVKMIFPLSETCEENRAFFGEGGACEALYEVILQYNDDEYLKTIALDAMSILSTNELNFRRLTTIGAMNLVNNNKGIINTVTTTVASTIHGIFEKQISQGSTTSGASGASRSSKDSK